MCNVKVNQKLFFVLSIGVNSKLCITLLEINNKKSNEHCSHQNEMDVSTNKKVKEGIAQIFGGVWVYIYLKQLALKSRHNCLSCDSGPMNPQANTGLVCSDIA